MSLDDEGTVEDEDLVDQTARMIPVVDDDRIDTDIEVFDFEVEFGTLTQPFTPVRRELRLAANDAVGSFDDTACQRGREDDVVAEVTQDGAEVVGVPGDEPIGCELLRGCGVQWVNLDDVRRSPQESNVRRHRAESSRRRQGIAVFRADRTLVMSQGATYSGFRLNARDPRRSP